MSGSSAEVAGTDAGPGIVALLIDLVNSAMSKWVGGGSTNPTEFAEVTGLHVDMRLESMTGMPAGPLGGVRRNRSG